jgi:hypothetical protein
VTKRTVTNCGDRTVSTEGTVDYAVATKPDELKIVKKNKTEKFNNWATSDQLIGGTSKSTTIAGCAIWTMPGKLGPPSHPTHGPGYLGTKNGMMPADGEAEAFTASTNLKAENNPVVRVKDETFQNRRNTTGEVMPELVLMDLSDAGGDEGGGSAFAQGAGGGVKKPGAGARQQGDRLLQPSGEAPVDTCDVLEIAAACQHGRRARNGLLQVVGIVWDDIRLEARRNGPCKHEHPVWIVEGGPLPAGAPVAKEQSSFKATVPEYKPCRGLGKHVDKITDRVPNRYRVRCQGCKNNAHAITIEAFEPGLRKVQLTRGPLWSRIIGLNIAAQIVGLEETDLGPKPDPATPIIDALAGAIVGTVQVVEHIDNRAYVQTQVSIQFDPVLQICFKLDLLGLVTDLIASRLLGFSPAQAAKLRTGRAGVRMVKKKWDEFIEYKNKKLGELEDKLSDLQDELDELLGREPDEGRQARARQMLKDFIAKSQQISKDMAPIQIPDTEIVGDFNLKLAIDLKARTTGPDDQLLSMTGSCITGFLGAKLAASQKTRFGIFVLRVPCEASVKLSGSVKLTRLGWTDLDYRVGVEEGVTECEYFMECHSTVGSMTITDIPPTEFKGKLTTQRLQVFPDLQVVPSS